MSVLGQHDGLGGFQHMRDKISLLDDLVHLLGEIPRLLGDFAAQRFELVGHGDRGLVEDIHFVPKKMREPRFRYHRANFGELALGEPRQLGGGIPQPRQRRPQYRQQQEFRQHQTDGSQGEIVPERRPNFRHRVADIGDDHQMGLFPLVETGQRKQSNLILAAVDAAMNRLFGALGQRSLPSDSSQNQHVSPRAAQRRHLGSPWLEPAFAIAVLGGRSSLPDDQPEIRARNPLKIEHDIRQGHA